MDESTFMHNDMTIYLGSTGRALVSMNGLKVRDLGANDSVETGPNKPLIPSTWTNQLSWPENQRLFPMKNAGWTEDHFLLNWSPFQVTFGHFFWGGV